MTSIILPAHNESAVINLTIDSILQNSSEVDEVIVVVNGSSDNTAEMARKFGSKISVIETPIASKTNALNLGDSQATIFPRIYMDADIQLTDGSLDKLIKLLLEGDLLAVSPIPKMDLSDSTWAVKAYYEIWLSLPYCQSGMMGAGVYALSEDGRKRFDKFPDIIADDGYVRALFKEHERGSVKGAYAIVTAPKNLYWLLKIKVRSRLGQMELAQKFPELVKNEKKDYSGGFKRLLLNPLKWPKLTIYIYVSLLTRSLAKKKLTDISNYQWEKDMSSRSKKEKNNT